MEDLTPVGGVEVESEAEQAPRGDVGDVQATNDRIGVGSGDENVAKIQLAARWTEAFAPPGGDSLEGALQRFHRAYAFLDSVTHSVQPEAPWPDAP